MNPLSIETTVIKAIVGILIIIMILGGFYYAGMTHEKAVFALEKAADQAKITELVNKSRKITTVVETKYVDRIKTVYVKGATINHVVDHYITKEDDKKCPVPSDFSKIYNAAIKGQQGNLK